MSHDEIKAIQGMTLDEVKAMAMSFNLARARAAHIEGILSDPRNLNCDCQLCITEGNPA